MSNNLDALLAERAIQPVLTTYSRGFAGSYVRGRRGPDDIVYHI